jgi:predicted nucleotidyltransferase
MPVRPLNWRVFKWPDRETVLTAAREWAAELCQRDPTVERVLCIGSYARGDWGVGSDIDVIVLVSDTDLSWPERYAKYYPDGLPVQADVWVYTRAEWQSLATRSPHLWKRLQREMLELG